LALVEATDSLVSEEREENNIYAGEFSAAAAAPPAYDSTFPPEELPVAHAKVATPAAAVVVMKRRSPLRWAIPAGALAAAAILWVAFQPARHALQQAPPAVEVAQNKEAPPGLTARSEIRREENEPAKRATRGDVDQLTKTAPEVSTDLKSAAPVPPQTHPRSAEGSGFGAGSAAAPAANAKSVPQEKKADEVVAFSDSRDVVAQAPAIEADSEKIGVAKRIQAPASGAAKPAAPPPPTPAVGGAAGQAVGGAPAKQRTKEERKDKDTVTTEAAAANQMAQAPIGGRSYQAMTLSTGVARAPQVISVAGSNHAWRVGEQGKIEFTSNGGKEWKEQVSGVNASLASGSAPSKKVCWIAGRNGVLLVTTDTGKHWRQVTTPITADLGGVSAVDGLRARIRDAANTAAYETSDGGKTWSSIPFE